MQYGMCPIEVHYISDGVQMMIYDERGKEEGMVYTTILADEKGRKERKRYYLSYNQWIIQTSFKTYE